MSKHAPYIGHFVADRLHVWASRREVIRTARSVLTPEYRRGPTHRDRRHELYRAALLAHDENRHLFQTVMGGRLD